MSQRVQWVRRIPAAVLTAAVLAGAGVSAQEGRRAAGSTARTADGQPDLQGTWTNATSTALERPARYAGRATLTEQEVAELDTQSAARAKQGMADRVGPAVAPRAGAGVGSYNNAVWSDSGTKVVATRQTSGISNFTVEGESVV